MHASNLVSSDLESISLAHKLKNQWLPFVILSVLFIITLCTFWPGITSPDSMTQYTQALQGVFGDHHPPMMAFVWRFLNFIYPGPGLMLGLNLALLFGSAAIFAGIFYRTRWIWFFVLIPLLPQILGLSIFILKDISFTLSFLFLNALLSYYIIKQQTPSKTMICLISILLFYGTAVKYQAIFIAPILILWLLFSIKKKFSKEMLFFSLLGFGVLFFGLMGFNKITIQQKNYSWQYVKLYDLAAISTKEHKAIFPDFVTSNPNFSLENLEKHFNTRRVDDLVWGKNPPLIIGRDDKERMEILQYWKRAVLDNPKAYFSHRFELFKNLINISPIKPFTKLESERESIPFVVEKTLLFLERLGVFSIINLLTSFQLFLPISLIYIVFSVLAFKVNIYAKPLLMMNGMGLLLLSVLFIFSMAVEARYIYLTQCLFHFSHPFFIKLILTLKGSK